MSFSSAYNVFSKNSFLHMCEGSPSPVIKRSRSYSLSTTFEVAETPFYTMQEAESSPVGSNVDQSMRSLCISSYVTGEIVNIQRATSSSASSETSEEIGEVDTRTSVMVRNIPCRYNQTKLVQEIQELDLPFDFLYLPPAKHSRGNLGYAFINFEHNDAATKFIQIFAGHRFKAQPNSKKRAETLFCTIQGLEQNMNFYSGSNQSRFRPYHKQKNSDIKA